MNDGEPLRDLASLTVDHARAAAALGEEIDVLVAVLDGLSDHDVMAASRCRGWCVADVLAHLHLGAQEMCLGLLSPTDDPPDADAATYWLADRPTNDPHMDAKTLENREAAAIAQVRFTRLLAAAYQRPTGLVGHLRPTLIVLRGALDHRSADAVRFQGRVLSVGDFLTTWAVELAVHHLDLGAELALPPPAPAAHELALATLDALAGVPFPACWSDERAVLVGTGRVAPTEAERSALGHVTERLPLLG